MFRFRYRHKNVGVDQAGHLPTFISVTDGKTGDVTVARTWTFPAGSVVVADRAYLVGEPGATL